MRPENKKRPAWQTIAACAAFIGIVCGAASCANNGNDKLPASLAAKALVAAEYPKTYPYPDESVEWEAFNSMLKPWSEAERERRTAGYTAVTPRGFYRDTIREFLSSADGNKAYSPLNVYFALSILAETTGGESRAQILDLLGDSGIEQLRGHANGLWKASYRDDGLISSVFANSVWLKDGVSLKKSTLDILAEDYYASSFSGDLSSGEMTALLREWLNAQTRGLLKDSVEGIELSPEAVLALCSTAYFSAKWEAQFSKNDNDTRVFRSQGGDVEREFMNGTSENGFYYGGDDFGAMSLYFEDGGCMWFILPDEGKTADDVLASEQYLDMLLSPNDYQNKKQVIIHHSVPKFDVSSDADLTDGLKALGVSDVFDFGRADFSPLLSDTSELAVTEVRHSVRVVIDEEGCTAAAVTAMMLCGAALPPGEEIYFVLDRPFIFAVMSDMGQPLFMGVVNDP